VVICVCLLVLCSPLSLLKLILYHILYNERPFNFFTILYAKSPDLFRPQDRVTDHPQAMTRRVNSTWCRHMGPNPPRAADRWGPGCLSIFPVRACPDQTRRLQTIPLPYPLPISLSIISLRCGYPLPLSLSFLISLRPSASAQGSPPVASAFARPAACAFDGLTGDPS
jgi:hypothetical protein